MDQCQSRTQSIQNHVARNVFQLIVESFMTKHETIEVFLLCFVSETRTKLEFQEKQQSSKPCRHDDICICFCLSSFDFLVQVRKYHDEHFMVQLYGTALLSR